MTICLLTNLEQCEGENNILSNIPKPKDLDFGIWDSAITELRRRRGDFKVGKKKTLEEGSDYSAQPPDNPNPGRGGGIKLKLNEPAEGRIQVKPIKGRINRNLKEYDEDSRSKVKPIKGVIDLELKEQHTPGNSVQKPIDSLNPKEHDEGKIEVKPLEDDNLLWRGRTQQGQKPVSEQGHSRNEEKERKKKAFQKRREHRKEREERHEKRENKRREEIERKQKAFRKRREHRKARKERKENREQRKHSNRTGSGQQEWISSSVARSAPIFYDNMEDSTPANTENDGGRKPQNRKMSGFVHHGSAQWEHKGGIFFTYSTSNTETRVINNKPVVVRTETKIGNNVKNVTTYWDDERGKAGDVLVIFNTFQSNSFTLLFSPGKSYKKWSSFN